MGLNGQDTPDTRTRLLDAAGEVFAARGFRDATVREVCSRAGANIAAVHYHFGDKERLYRATLDYAARLAMEQHPIGLGVPADAVPEQRLAGFVRNFMNRLLGDDRLAWHGTLLAREMVEPTSVLDDLARTYARPQFVRLREIVIELLGPRAGADADLVRMCCASVIGQCLFYKTCRPMVERVMPELAFDEPGRARLTRHITEFTLGALRALRLRQDGPPGKERP